MCFRYSEFLGNQLVLVLGFSGWQVHATKASLAVIETMPGDTEIVLLRPSVCDPSRQCTLDSQTVGGGVKRHTHLVEDPIAPARNIFCPRQRVRLDLKGSRSKGGGCKNRFGHTNLRLASQCVALQV